MPEPLSDSIAKKVTNLIRDARQAILFGMIPIIGLIMILRLVQWYLLKKQYPILLEVNGEHADLAKDFRATLPRLWFAVLFWPVLLVLMTIYLSIWGR